MSATYNKLLDEWRAAVNETREAQQKLKEQFDAFLEGRGPEPGQEAIDHVQALRAAESAKLEAAIARSRLIAGRSQG